MVHRGQERRGGNVEVPDIVADFLKVPEVFARGGVEGDQTIGIKIVTGVVDADEVRLG